MKTFIATSLFVLVALVACEPPTSRNQYLPPGQSPTNNYLPPNPQQGPSGREHPVSGHQDDPSSAYAAPAPFSNPQTQYGAPSRHGPSSGNHQQSPASAYGAPAETTSAFNRPQSEYGAPAAGNDGYSFNGGRQEENYGPAKYEFQYDVQDYPSGQDFGHKEARDGDKVVGGYYVLLPDGRKQIVQYEADEQGYRPVISYEDTGAGKSGISGGYDNNAQENGKINGY